MVKSILYSSSSKLPLLVEGDVEQGDENKDVYVVNGEYWGVYNNGTFTCKYRGKKMVTTNVLVYRVTPELFGDIDFDSRYDVLCRFLQIYPNL